MTTLVQPRTPSKETFHIANARLVREAVQQRFPAWADACQPYENVLTLRAWNRRGYRVKKGEKAIRVLTTVPIVERDSNTGEEKIAGSRALTAYLFALPQVEK